MKTKPDPKAKLAKLREQLTLRDIADCTCNADWKPVLCLKKVKHLARCPHVLAARSHNMTLKEWLRRLTKAFGDDEYKEPPEPPNKILTLSREARVAAMDERQSAHYGLRNPGDKIRHNRLVQLAGEKKVVPDTERQRNGRKRVVPEETLAAVQALATREQAARLICRGRAVYSVSEVLATNLDRARLLLRVEPEDVAVSLWRYLETKHEEKGNASSENADRD